MADAVTKLLIEKGVVAEAEFKQKLAGVACCVSAHSEAHAAVMIRPGNVMPGSTDCTPPAPHNYSFREGYLQRGAFCLTCMLDPEIKNHLM